MFGEELIGFAIRNNMVSWYDLHNEPSKCFKWQDHRHMEIPELKWNALLIHFMA